MNWKFPVSAASPLTAFFLVSCGHFGKKSANEIIVRNPTVADIQKLDAEWGMAPKPVATGTSSTTSTTVPATGGAAQTVTTTSTTSTTTAPEETTPAVTPPAVPPSLR